MKMTRKFSYRISTLLKKYGILKIIFHTGKSMEFEAFLAKVWEKYGIFENPLPPSSQLFYNLNLHL
jgi:hypothetical protein